MESSEFTMSHEDFPALPGSNPVAAAAAAAAAAANQLNSNQVKGQCISRSWMKYGVFK